MSFDRIIAITRQYGSGGHDIGKALAERLGISFYDKESRRPKALCTVRFGSRGGFACRDQRLHPLTRYSVSAREFHFSVSASPIKVVREY